MIRIMVVLLHNIRSVQNVASIFRTADGVGVEKIYLCGITPGPLDRLGHSRAQFVKVSLGAEKNVPHEKSISTVKTMEGLRKDGYQIVSIEQAKNSTPHYQFKIGERKTALVLGSEVAGLPATILKKSDKILEIPMEGKKESLNVAVAFGIVVYALKYK
jgi:23S rRNA (guanosine2251-2'-O)-methyltransferase